MFQIGFPGQVGPGSGGGGAAVTIEGVSSPGDLDLKSLDGTIIIVGDDAADDIDFSVPTAPTTGEKAALVGTFGAPGAANKYLTETDTVFALADKSRPATWVEAADLVGRSIVDLGTKDHDLLSGLADDDHSQYMLLAGRVGGQTLIGGTAADENLTLTSTVDATKGKILFGTSAYDEVNNRLGIGTTGPITTFEIKNFPGSGATLRFTDTQVAHGMTALGASFNPTPATDTFCQIQKLSSGGGGACFQGFSDLATTPGIELRAIIGNVLPTQPVVLIRGSKKDAIGTGEQSLADDESLLAVQNRTGPTRLFEIFGNGDVTIVGALSGLAQLNVDNLRLDGNTLSSQNENGDILLAPDGTGRVGVGTLGPNAPLDVVGAPGAVVGGFASGILHVTNPSALANANSVITGHNLNAGNKQLWYLGSVSSSNDNIAFINRQSGSLAFLTDNATRMTILAASNTLQGNAGMTLQGGSGVHTLTLSGGASAASSISIGIGSELIGFFGASPVLRPTGVGVTTAQIHAALVTLGLITV